MKFTHDGEVVVSLERGGDSVSLWIEDSGIGMDEATAQRVFEPFTQADASSTRRYGGTGLGLAITKSICEALSMSLSLESTPGVGTSVHLELPTSLEMERHGESLSQGTLSSGIDHTILLIDDDPAAHELVSRYLASPHRKIVSTSTGKEGIDLARRVAPDLVLLDLVLPDVSGWEVLERLRSNPQTRDIPIIIASIVADEKNRGFAMGVRDYLVKPFSREALLMAFEGLEESDESMTGVGE